jgi:fructose-1,6-bisphosphatase I
MSKSHEMTSFLDAYAGSDPTRSAVAQTVLEIGAAGRKLWGIAQDASTSADAIETGINPDGDKQTELDIVADGIFLAAARRAPVAAYASEELAEPVLIEASRPLALAIDPLDGSSNVELNLSFGTIFSILPVLGGVGGNPVATFLQPGSAQLAAGLLIYGPKLSLVLSLGSGTQIFAYSDRVGGFVLVDGNVRIPAQAREFAINASNYRHWDESVRLYFDDCVKGVHGPRERDFNMRWLASLVVEAYRILVRGGVFLYPSDKRPGYSRGRLRLVYEANPVAFLVEQAGGRATNGVEPILSLTPESLHQRTPLIFGSGREVAKLTRYHTEPSAIEERAPLFGNRGLFRT